ncbi:hypothetical protein BG004_007093, partial [Podila humilis]
MATTRTSPPAVDARALDSLLQNTLELHRQLFNRQAASSPSEYQHSQHPPSSSTLTLNTSVTSVQVPAQVPALLDSNIEFNSLTASRPHIHPSPIETSQNNLSGFLSSSSSASSFDDFDTTYTSTEFNSPKDTLPGMAFPGLTATASIQTYANTDDTLLSPELSSSRTMSPQRTPSASFVLVTSGNRIPQQQQRQQQLLHSDDDPVSPLSSYHVSESMQRQQQRPPISELPPFVLTPPLSKLPPPPPPPPQQHPPRRIKTSLTTLAGTAHGSRLVRHLIGNQESTSTECSNTNASVIQIHIRYVPKDLWVKIDLPRDISVSKARDIILTKCHLTSMPPIEASPAEQSPTQAPDGSPSVQNQDFGKNDCGEEVSVDSKTDFKYELDLVTGQHSQLNLDINNLMAVSRNSLTLNDIIDEDGNDDSDDQESSDDEEAELRAEALMANDNLFGDNNTLTNTQRVRTVSLQGKNGAMQGHRRSNSMTLVNKSLIDRQETLSLKGETRSTVDFAPNTKYTTSSNGTNGNNNNNATSINSNGQYGLGPPRIVEIQAIIRLVGSETAFLGGVITGIDNRVRTVSNSNEKYLTMGHWLDDSRMINSYQLQPNCLLELQLKNNYIQLPPPGGQLNYYDHYAEGVLYKMSKKSGAVSKLTNHGISSNVFKDNSGVWKERWVVLQGTKLFLYHKRKETANKVIELTVPLRISTTTLPLNPRQSFKMSQSSAMAPLSTTMITLTMSSNPSVPKICFRATSES